MPYVVQKGSQLPLKIFLLGFMGSGKSHWGQIWAAKSHLKFYDLDTTIEHSFKMTIADIFEKEGEEKFRELERYYLRKIEKEKNFVLACGGGTPCFSDNMNWMIAHGTTIYLKASPETLLQQVTDETEKRPVIKNINPSELLFFIQGKLQEREPFYSQAAVTLPVEQLHADSLVELLQEID